MKRSYLLGVALAVTVLSACGQSKEPTDGSASGSADSFKVTTVRWSDWGDDFTKGFLEEAQENAGIEIDWDVHIASDWGEKKSVLIASGDLPDAFLGSNAFNDAEIAQNQSLFIPLEEMIEAHMPNLTRIMQEDPKIRAMITSPDGHIYGLPKKLPMRPITSNQLFINQTWLDNLGLDLPDTYEDFIDVLTAFKEEDANGNGDLNDEIPYGVGNFSEIFSFILPFDNRMGADNTYDMTVKEGVPTFLRTEESYRDGLAWMHEAYQNGLIDPELFTADTSMSDAKRMNKDNALVGVAAGWTADATFGLHAQEYVALPPLKGPDGNRYVISDPDHYNYGRNELLITTSCSNPEELLKWADQFYTDDASIQTFYGSFGVGTEKDGENYTVLPPQDGKSADEWAWIQSLRDFGPKYVDDDFNDRVEIDTSQGDGLKLLLDEEMREYALPAFPNVIYTQEELARLSAVFIDLSSYINQISAKWVVEGGIEDEWDDYLAQLETMGLTEFMEIQQEAFSRYEAALN
jgi:putative aldouronate transport system substrate-binding protein